MRVDNEYFLRLWASRIILRTPRLCPLPQVDGTKDKPIVLRGEPGSSREEVVLKGHHDRARVLEIFHSYYIIEVHNLGGEEENHLHRKKLCARRVLDLVATWCICM